MSEKTIQTLLNAAFPKPDKHAWSVAATAEIKKENPLQALSWITSEGLSFLPLYDKNDTSELKYLNAFNLPPSPHGYQGVRSWINLPCVTVSDEITANKTALQHLSNGADGILFNIQKEEINIAKLLNKIEWPYCHLSFAGNLSDSFYKNIAESITSHDKQLQGSLLTTDTSGDFIKRISNKNIQCVGIVIPRSTPVNEIVYGLKTAVNQVDKLTDTGIDVNTAIHAITFSISIGADLFIEIAKLKTLRMLWYQITRAFTIDQYKPGNLHIHARVESEVNEKFQPHGSLLKDTLNALSAVLGGCDSLTVYPDDESNTMMSRVARNVSNTLREESHLDKVADPTAGSYALENMINELGKKAWEEFKLNSTL